MAETTYEEAKRCPKCQEPGQEGGTRPIHGGGEMKTIYCRNSRCAWFNTSYIVQVRSDGTVPEPTLNREKSFPKIPDRTEAYQAQMERLQNSTLIPGSEIPN